MNVLERIVDLINQRKNKVLLFAQSSLPESQFKAFKRLFLDEFGQRGLEGDLERMFTDGRQLERNGMGGNIHARKEVRK